MLSTCNKKVTKAAIIITSLGVSLSAISVFSSNTDAQGRSNVTSGVIKHLSNYIPEVSEISADDMEEIELTLEELYENIEVKKVSYKRYPTSILNVRKYPTTDSDIVGKLVPTSEIHVIGEIKGNEFVQIKYKDNAAYVHCDYLTNEKPKQPEQSVNYNWSGPTLNSRVGTIQGPSGKETYYNLNMSGVIRIMRSRGYTGEYWVRNDGVKMLGQYVMVAADLDIRPRGSLVPTSLGMGMVCDTGTFIYSNPTQIDIATAW